MSGEWVPARPLGAHRASPSSCRAVLPALPLCTPTWEQLLAQGAAPLPVVGSQLCGPMELLQGQTLGQDVGLGVRARVQLRSKQRREGVRVRPPTTSNTGLRGPDRKRSRGRPFTSLLLGFPICDRELIIHVGLVQG